MSDFIDNNWIEEIVKKYSNMLFRIAYTYMKNVDDSEDIVHDAYMIIMQKKPNFVSEEHTKAWLIRVTINLCKNKLKTSWFQRRVPMDESIPFTKEENEVISAIKQLPSKYSSIIFLYYYEGYSIKEIAGILSSNVSTVSSWLQRGRKQLKQILKEDFDYEEGNL